jgi:hypothetical protein
MANVKLKNVSERTFVIGAEKEEKRIAPKQVFELDGAGAARLLELYPGEIVDLAKEAESAKSEPVKEPGSATDEANKLSVVQLREALKAKGIAFKPAASKGELVTLYVGAPAPESVTAVEATALTDDAKLEEGVVYKDAQGALFVGALNGDKVGLLPVDKLTDDERAALVKEGKLAA